MAFLDETGLAYFWNQILARLNKFVPAESGKGLSSNDYTVEEKTKLAGIEEGANKTVIDSALSASSTNPVQNKVINTALDSKVDKIEGKGLSTNDYTTTEKNKLAGIADGANVNVQADWNVTDTASDAYIKNKPSLSSFIQQSDTANEGNLVVWDTNGIVRDGGPVPTKLPNPKTLTAGTKTYDGSVAISITASDIGAATQSDMSALQDELSNKADISNGQYAITTAGDGAAYTATVPGIASLTAGASFIMIPHVVSTSTTPTLNVNGLGAKNIKRRLTSLATAAQAGYTAAWLAKGLPFRVIYDGTQWIAEGHDKPAGADLYGAAAKATADANGNVITDTYATITALQDLLPKVKTITLGTTWEGTGPYYQDVELSYVTAEHMVDLQPTVEQIISWKESGYAFTTFSGTGSVRVYAIGNLPTESISVQTRAQKVSIVS